MFRYTLLRLLVALSVLALISCSRQSRETNTLPEIEVEYELQPDIPSVGSSQIIFRLSEGGIPVEGAAITARGDMSHAGMKAVITEAEETQPGLYQTPFEWTMAGDWVLTLEITLEDGRFFQRAFDISVQGAE